MDVKKYFLSIIDVKIPFVSACFQTNWFEMQLGQDWLERSSTRQAAWPSPASGRASDKICFFLKTSQQLLCRETAHKIISRSSLVLSVLLQGTGSVSQGTASPTWFGECWFFSEREKTNILLLKLEK